jgi:hypothetical protein
MIATISQFKTNDLEHLVSAIPRYPISVKSLISIASRKKLSPEVINFYRRFPQSDIFEGESDLVNRTEVVNLLQAEEVSQPTEDQVRGAED